MGLDARDFTVGGWEVRPLHGEARRGAEVVHLEPKVMEVLVALARSGGKVLSRKALTEAVWPDTFVEDQAVTRAVFQLRHALGWHKDDCLQTIPKHGYRLAAPVLAAPDPEVSSSAVPSRRRRWPRAALLAAGGLFAILAIAFLVRPALFGMPGSRQRVMLAVLPFQNLTGVADQEYVCDGLTEELITRLGALEPKRLGVIARTSSFTYKNSTKRADQIGRELDVDYLLEGSVRQEGDRVRIVAQLISTKDQTHVWAQGYEDDRGHLLRLHDRVADAITQQIVARVAPGATSRMAGRALDPDAHESYLKGRYALARATGTGALSACDFFDRAIAREPGYAQAWAGLATAYTLVANYIVRPADEVCPKAKAAAIKALELEPSLVDARLALASIKMEYEWDFSGAEREFRQAVTGSPNSAQAHQWYGSLLGALGRFDEAIDEVEQAHRLDPVSLRVGVDLGRAYYYARRYDLAVAEYQKVIAVEPEYSAAHTYLGLARLEQRRYAEGIAELEEGVRLLANSDGYSTFLGYAYAVGGRKADAEQFLVKQTDKWGKQGVGAYGMALTYVGLRDRANAFAWLDKAYSSREAALVMLEANPYWDPIRADSRFQALLRRLGLPA